MGRNFIKQQFDLLNRAKLLSLMDHFSKSKVILFSLFSFSITTFSHSTAARIKKYLANVDGSAQHLRCMMVLYKTKNKNKEREMKGRQCKY